MLRKNCVLFALFTFTYSSCAKIVINVTINTHNDIKIKSFGDDNKLITINEVYIFGLTDDNLKWGVRVELGKVPDEMFLKNPTPYGELYTKYDWEEVKRNVKVKEAKVLEVIKEKTVLNTCVYVNNATEPLKAKGKLSQTVENTVSSRWSIDGLPSDEIFYDININFGTGILAYENKWRNSTIRYNYLPIGLTIGDFFVNPGQEIVVQLSAYKLIVVVEIIYEARLVGNLVANFAKVYGKYHFWAPTINDIMKRVHLKNLIQTREVIEIRCYTDPVLIIYDKLTGKKVPIIRKSKMIPLQTILKHKQQFNF